MRTAATRRSVGFAVLAVVCLNAKDDVARLDELSREGMKAVARQDYAAAHRILSEGSAAARQTGALKRAALFENAICGANFLAMQYAASLRACAEAISLARMAGEMEIMGVAEYNRSNFLLSLGDWNGARIGIERALTLLPPGSVHRVYALTTLGVLELREMRWSQARRPLHLALELAGGSQDRRAEAFAWSALGELELRAGSYGEAERAFLSAYRLRRLHKLPQLEATWSQMGHLELARGRPGAALTCFKHALAARRNSKANYASFLTLEGAGEALEGLGRKDEARAAYKQALAESTVWRNEMAPSEGLEIAADVRLGRIVSGLIELCGNDPVEVWDAFDSLESVRAAGLRRQTLVNRNLAGKLSKQHSELIREVRQQGLRALRGEPGAAEALRLAESKLTKLEAESHSIPVGASWGKNDGAMCERISRSLKNGEVLISFWTGDKGSRVWAVSKGNRASVALPAADALSRLVEAQREAIAKGEGEAESARLFDVLFGGIPKSMLAEHDWNIVADGPLWSVAWAALRSPRAKGGQYLIESRTLDFLPSAAWLTQRSTVPTSQLMVAAGDAIHNRADSRLRGVSGRVAAAPLSFWVWPRPAAERSPTGLELPTLAGSRKELEVVCGAWGPADCLAIRGPELTADRLEKELSRRPAVVHLATHLVEDASPAEEGTGRAFLALSLNSRLEREGFWTSGVSRLQAPGALIVLSACGSVRGEVLPGAGLQGFGRAWLAAGARGALGTLWAVPDGNGEFFRSFYRELRGGASPNRALRASQLKAISDGATPSHWAAYTILGKD